MGTKKGAGRLLFYGVSAQRSEMYCLSLDAFVASLRTYTQLLAALRSARAQDVTSVGRGHVLAETVLVSSLAY